MLIFPYFNKVFEIHTDGSDYMLGSIISQDQKMLSIVETLNKFCTMLLGHKLKIYTDHKNPINLTTVFKSP
jgi:hypothetical protein